MKTGRGEVGRQIKLKQERKKDKKQENEEETKRKRMGKEENEGRGGKLEEKRGEKEGMKKYGSDKRRRSRIKYKKLREVGWPGESDMGEKKGSGMGRGKRTGERR